MRSKHLSGLFIGLMVCGCLIGVLVPAGLGWDFANFYDAGRRVAAGDIDDLYRPAAPIAGKPPQGTTGFYGTPLSAVFYRPMARLSPETALVWFKIENVAAYAAALLLLFSFYRVFAAANGVSAERFAAWFTGLCLIFQPFWTVFRVGGQTTPTVFLLVAMATILHTNARFWGSAICLVIAVLIKPAFAPILIFLLCTSGLAFLWRTTVVGALTGLLSLALLGWQAHLDFLMLLRESARSTWRWYYNSSTFVLLDNIKQGLGRGDDDPTFAALTIALQISVIIGVLWLTVRAHRQHWSAPAMRHFDANVAILLFLWWSRTVWEHYLAVLFVPLLYIVANPARFSRGARGVVMAIVGLSLFQNLIFTTWLRSFGVASLPALLAVALLKTGPLLLTMFLVMRYQRELFDSYAAWSRPLRSDA
jgi:hypothetical protein